MRALVLVALFACVHAPTPLRDHGVRGGVLVADIASGEVVVAEGDVDVAVKPLSIAKLYAAALWWENGLGDGDFTDRGRGHVTVEQMLMDSLDAAGEQVAITVRERIGEPAALAQLHRLGLDPVAGADDATWGRILSIGERGVTVTLRSVADFLRAIATGTRMQPETARRLRAAMLAAVAHGTGRGVLPLLAGSDRVLGGKTGSGPAGQTPLDGWFAGIIYIAGAPRYAVCVRVERRGPGGGVAAQIAAELALRVR